MDRQATFATLADLRPGERVEIMRIVDIDANVERLMVMGLIEGATVEYVRCALGGDPLEFRVHGAAISLRRAQARSFVISGSPGYGRHD